MTIQQCRYVLEIAKRGSFTEASKALYIAQASLSSAVKDLEDELNIHIFQRSNKGTRITKEGAEFIRYAGQIVSQVDSVMELYGTKGQGVKCFSVSTQHYDFVAEAFVSFLQNTKEKSFNFSLKETKTFEVIQDVMRLGSDLGILAVKQGAGKRYMERIFKNNHLIFNPIFEINPHVFVRKNHPLAAERSITHECLQAFPYISYEQGEQSARLFSEELAEICEYDKSIKINDRATLLNLLIATDCYTVGTGIINSELNSGKIVSVPLENADPHVIGWLVREDVDLSGETKEFIKLLSDLV